MLEIARAKYKGDKEKGEEPLPGAEVYEKKAKDMKQLLALIQKQDKGTTFTKEELLFLYEVNAKIEGFGHNEDPRIEILLSQRNRQEDIQTICNCEPQFIADDFIDINESTQVFCEDTGKKITFVDFRLEQNQKKLPQLLELAQKIKENGSPARPDIGILGGIVDCSFEREQVKDKETTFKNFKEADNGTPSYIWSEWNNAKFEIPEGNYFETIVLSYNKDPNTRKSSDKIVADMDKLGLRPLTLEEMAIVGITHPEFTKEDNRYFLGLTKYPLGGDSCVPVLVWDGVLRMLNGYGWGNESNGDSRFLCVRK